MKFIKNKKGVILVFTMILMAVLLSVAVGFSFFIISDINQAKAIDDSIIAYYSADSGMERSLYSIIKKRAFESIEELKNDNNLYSTGRPLLASKADWSIASSTDYEKIFFRQRLYNGQSAKFYVLGRNNAEGKPKSLLVNWKKGPESIVNLQISMTQLSPQNKDIGTEENVLIYYTDTNEVEISDSLNNGKGSTCYNFKDALLPNNNNPFFDYIVELKALGGNYYDYIDQISVTVYDQDCNSYFNDKQNYLDSLNPKGISNLTIKAEGFFGKSKQLIIANLPPRNLASGLFSFVIFSEQDITKE